MKQSEQITELALALAQFQGNCPEIKKTKENPYFKSKYAGLDDIINTVRKPLAEAGLSLSQFPTDDSLTTVLMHKSGQYIQGSMPITAKKKDDPQAYGSALTYARRYAYASVLGLAVGDEDDDGNAAAAPQPKKNHPKKAFQNGGFERAVNAVREGKYTTQEIESNYILTDAQRKELEALKNG